MKSVGKIGLGIIVLVALAIAVGTYVLKGSSPKTEQPAVGDTQTISAGIGQEVGAFGIQIKPLELLEDSRCPADVQCIWAGTVKIKAQVTTSTETKIITLELNKTQDADGAQITLIDLKPGKVSSQQNKPEDYLFYFEVKKL